MPGGGLICCPPVTPSGCARGRLLRDFVERTDEAGTHDADSPAWLADVAHTLRTGRRPWPSAWRSSRTPRADLLRTLADFLADRPRTPAVPGQRRAGAATLGDLLAGGHGERSSARSSPTANSTGSPSCGCGAGESPWHALRTGRKAASYLPATTAFRRKRYWWKDTGTPTAAAPKRSPHPTRSRMPGRPTPSPQPMAATTATTSSPPPRRLLHEALGFTPGELRWTGPAQPGCRLGPVGAPAARVEADLGLTLTTRRSSNSRTLERITERLARRCDDAGRHAVPGAARARRVTPQPPKHRTYAKHGPRRWRSSARATSDSKNSSHS
ncbi:hypothetical protein LV779_34445 [Streptomyces thinghirensis]|nr:hypothetical protein [Streptomyces thinghirensis]